MVEIKGYAIFLGKKVPVTWEEQDEKYIRKVWRVIENKEQMMLNYKMFDGKMRWEEVELVDKSIFKKKMKNLTIIESKKNVV